MEIRQLYTIAVDYCTGEITRIQMANPVIYSEKTRDELNRLKSHQGIFMRNLISVGGRLETPARAS